MASPSSPQHEPTMEEILASIRKIISEDTSEPAPAPQAAAAPLSAAPVHDADVLELTHEVEEAPAPVVAAAPPPPPAPEPLKPVDEVVFQSVEEPTPAPAAAAPLQHEDAGDIVSDKARSAIDDALAGLDFGSEETQAASAGSVAPISGLSVESVFDRAIRETFDPVLRAWLQEHADTIVERMKPVIREWIEDNLPAMLKTAVEAEVARAVRARSKR